MLPLERCYHRHHGLHKSRPLSALRAKAALAPQHPGTDRPLCRIGGWLNPYDLHERPQRLAPLQDVSTRPCGCRHITPAAFFQQPLHLSAERGHVGAKGRSFERALAHPMPPRKHLVRLGQQGHTKLL